MPGTRVVKDIKLNMYQGLRGVEDLRHVDDAVDQPVHVHHDHQAHEQRQRDDQPRASRSPPSSKLFRLSAASVAIATCRRSS